MPPRITRPSLAGRRVTCKNAPRKKSAKRGLDAYVQAQKLVPQEQPVPRHRLGEIDDDQPRPKRRRSGGGDDDDDGDGGGDDDDRPQRKRPAQRRDRDRDGERDYGSDSDGREIVLGGLAGDGDDSDLDSDAAFGESDQERFEGFVFRGSAKPKSTKKAVSRRRDGASDVDLDEKPESEDDSGDSQDEEGLGLGDDAVDLAALLDDHNEEQAGAGDGEESSGSEDGDDEGSEDESEQSGDEDVDEEGVARLRDFLEGLDAKSGAKKPEAPQRSIATLDDFADGTEVAAVRAKLKKKHQPKAIAAPLPKRQQERINREIAAQKAKEQLDRWRDTVIHNRKAETLQFPLQHPDDQGVTLGKEKFLPATLQAPANELEERIQRIMLESGLQTKRDGEEGANREDDVEAGLLRAEGLAVKHLPVEEVERRRAELRRARDLLFREEIKAKRIAKIKSKSYRRVHRKENERKAQREREALEGLGHEHDDEDEKEKHDRKRAEARMSTKHRDSKWAKSLKQTSRSTWDDGARNGVAEQARRNEELRKRMAGQDISDDDGSLSSPDDDSDNEIDEQKLQALKSGAAERNGLAGLKFMRAAEERKRKQNDEDVERLRKEMAIADGEEESEVEDESLGRAIFGPAGKETRRQSEEKRPELEVPEESDADDQDEATIVTEKPPAKTKVEPERTLKKTNTASGPLAKGLSTAADADSKPNGTFEWFKAAKKQSKNKAEVDAEVDLSLDNSSSVKAKAQPAPNNKPSADDASGDASGRMTVPPQKGDTASSDSEAEDPRDLRAPDRTLQHRAFAGDDVVSAFAAEKADLAASEDEKEVSHHLPGWGSWTGDGLSNAIKKANRRAAHNPLFKTKVAGVRRADRRDAALDHVIISEKQDRKGRKYLAPALPHGFETKEQYERSRRLPIGPEWTTKEVHQRMVKPRVIVKPGLRMEALEKPTV